VGYRSVAWIIYFAGSAEAPRTTQPDSGSDIKAHASNEILFMAPQMMKVRDVRPKSL
jgi:hypothetical protein